MKITYFVIGLLDANPEPFGFFNKNKDGYALGKYIKNGYFYLSEETAIRDLPLAESHLGEGEFCKIFEVEITVKL